MSRSNEWVLDDKVRQRGADREDALVMSNDERRYVPLNLTPHDELRAWVLIDNGDFGRQSDVA
jgi:hypothetical protein